MILRFPLMTVLLLGAAAPTLAPKKTRKNHALVLRHQVPLTDGDISKLLGDWDAFDRAMGSLHEAVPQIPAGGTDAAAAEAAWAADQRIRSALQTAGTTPEEFLALYRRVATAWWELLDSEARADSAKGLRREIDALRATKDDDSKEVLAELERGLESLEGQPKLSDEAEAVKRRRSELARIFSPEAPPAP